MLSRGCGDREVLMNFEFERSGCLEMYTALVAPGWNSARLPSRADRAVPLHEIPGTIRCRREVAVELEVMAHAADRPGVQRPKRHQWKA